MHRLFTGLRGSFPLIVFLGATVPAMLASPAIANQALSPAANPAPSADWQQRLAARKAELIAGNGAGINPAARDELLAMGQEDKTARGLVPGTPPAAGPAVTALDRKLTAQLKTIVTADGWPTVALVGYDASNAAMRVFTHSPDHAWQRQMLPLLERLATTGRIDGSTLAVAVDKELISEGKRQRYGTQFKSVGDGDMAMYAVDDPAGLDARRAAALLPPMDVYRAQLHAMYGLRLSNAMVMPTASASAGDDD